MFITAIIFVWSLLLQTATSSDSLPPSGHNTRATHNAIVHQDFQETPPFPILEIGLQHIISELVANGTEVPIEETVGSEKPSPKVNSLGDILPTQCGPAKPCADGSCCNSAGQCGFTDYNCNTTASTHCISNCDATAMCGRDSLYGQQKCPLNLCCSYSGYCGTTELYCVNTDPVNLQLPCQQGFGSCKVVQPPSCGNAASATPTASKGRKVAYYQGLNVEYRQCNRISPSQIETAGLTHLNFAFASIDPTSFKVVPNDPNDLILYPQFTALKSTMMQTWIAIGGFGFSDEGPTHTTWSDMVSTAVNRAAFIASTIEFMNKWGFQGVDLDWEFPAVPKRGGKPADTWNLVLLVREMRAAYGSKYGISIALAPDFYYLERFDPVAMEPWLNFINFMLYDLHGPWEANQLGAQIRAQTSIVDIKKLTVPLWFAGVSPPKINLGIAYYGRGYTVADRNCEDIGCPYVGPSLPGRCTQSPGVLSLREITEIIREKNLTPKLIPDSFVKQITWDDQWIGYDDNETIALKMQWADQHCLGGTAVWSIDFNSGAGSGDPGSPAASSPALPTSASPVAPTTSKAGVCNPSTPATSSSSSLPISKDGSCGDQATCLGSTFGNCCSHAGYCGSTDDYCLPSNGCQPKFGTCSGGSSNLNVSLDGICGKYAPDKTCKGSKFGDCCSQYGYCGSTNAYCDIGNGCQCDFGSCI